MIECDICGKEFKNSRAIYGHRRWHNLPEYKELQNSIREKRSYHMKLNPPMNSLEARRKVSESKKGCTPWNKNITGYTTLRKGQTQSILTRKHMRENHFSKTNPEKHRENYFKSKINIPTKFEKIFEKKLIARKIKYISQAPINNKYQVDFLIDNTVYEIDGSWHYKKGIIRDEDKQRDTYLMNNGYVVIRIKNNEVENYDI